MKHYYRIESIDENDAYIQVANNLIGNIISSDSEIEDGWNDEVRAQVVEEIRVGEHTIAKDEALFFYRIKTTCVDSELFTLVRVKSVKPETPYHGYNTEGVVFRFPSVFDQIDADFSFDGMFYNGPLIVHDSSPSALFVEGLICKFTHAILEPINF